MLADFGRHMPQEFGSKEQCLRWIQNKQLGTKRSITLLSKSDDWAFNKSTNLLMRMLTILR